MQNDMNGVMKVICSDFGFEVVGDYYDSFDMEGTIKFQREICPEWCTLLHEVQLIFHDGEWEIGSMQIDPVNNRYPYPLTLSEIEAFKSFIEAFKLYVKE